MPQPTGPHEPALMQAPGRQPDADAIVHEHLHARGAAAGEDIAWCGLAAAKTFTTRVSALSMPARMSMRSTASHTASTRITAATRSAKQRSLAPPRPAR